jgi:YidC/Oxa1 family membrane protein insertase
MDTYRALLAILISFVILLGYQYFFVGFDQVAPVDTTVLGTTVQQSPESSTQGGGKSSAPAAIESPPAAASPVVSEVVEHSRPAREITVETDLYSAILSEDGGRITSFVLKKHRETNAKDSPGMQLVTTDASQGFPLDFSWGSALPGRLLYDSETSSVTLSGSNEKGQLRMVAQADNGLMVERLYSFDNSTYLIDLDIRVQNSSEVILQGIPELGLVNAPFQGVSSPANRFLFGGPSGFINGELHEVSADEFENGPFTIKGSIDWAGYEGNYFLCAIVPLDGAGQSFTIQGNKEIAKSRVGGVLDTIQAGGEKQYKYHVFYGPKKLKMLQSIGFNLDRSVNFGWFDILAKPTLYLLNMFYSFFHNYGIAIILVTILFKAVFWPISQKGLKSMKNMQKLQPKMVKLKEKYKDDPQKMNQEVMSLYKTYKVNPLGGCLPMVLQIPVFFALYKVLLQSIELRHAPFMLWINDLAAPDRLWIGFDIPYLGGLPVLTLLMGASMFLQQKLSPTTADPTQAKIMMFLPVIFTFMFLNFASGLVLYWFVNNLLSILQQVLINREKKPAAT